MFLYFYFQFEFTSCAHYEQSVIFSDFKLRIQTVPVDHMQGDLEIAFGFIFEDLETGFKLVSSGIFAFIHTITISQGTAVLLENQQRLVLELIYLSMRLLLKIAATTTLLLRNILLFQRQCIVTFALYVLILVKLARICMQVVHFLLI